MSPRFVKLSRRSAEVFARMSFDTGDREECAAVAEVRVALKPKPLKKYVKKARARKAAKRLTKKDETAAIREAVVRRADARCENCGGNFLMELDHAFGRKNAPQSVRNCWLLCQSCHFAKTQNRPSVAYWLGNFIKHATKHGFRREANEAQRRLETLGLVAQQAFAVGKAAP